MSQEQLAEKLGVSRQAVTKWETERACPEAYYFCGRIRLLMESMERLPVYRIE